MRQALSIVSCCLLLAACGGEKSEYDKYYESDYEADTTQMTGPVAQTKPGADAGVNEVTEGAAAGSQGTSYEQGMKLISLSDCLACHKENEKLVGPAYMEVAKKYEFNDKNVDYLAGKIIEGGSGVWGQVPMTPHPNISREDAREMARYILALNKK